MSANKIVDRASEDPRPLIPKGEYEAVCVDIDENRFYGGRKLYVHFRIVTEGKFCEVDLFMVFNMPLNGRHRPSSKYFKTWVQVNGWIKPSRNAKMSPRIFKGKLFKIKTRDCLPKQPNGKPMPEHFRYSVVDSIVDVLEGGNNK